MPDDLSPQTTHSTLGASLPLLEADDEAEDAWEPGVEICGGPLTWDTVTMAPPPAPPPWLSSSAMDGEVAEAIDVGSRHTELALRGPSPPPEGPISAIDGVSKGNEEAILKPFLLSHFSKSNDGLCHSCR